MNRRVLCVDDEENVLRAFERNLRLHFEIETAVGPKCGLAAVQERGPYAVVISDLRMPEMDGIQFLSAVRKLAPDSVRLILSGNADLQAVIAAVNEGQIFQFLTKPCPSETLRLTIDGALRQFRLLTAERELLEVTLNGTIGVLMEALAVASPAAFGRTGAIRYYVGHMARQLLFPDLWELEAAAMLSLIGCITVPQSLLEHAWAADGLTPEEQKIFASHPIAGCRFLSGIPRMEAIAEIIRWQLTPFRELRAINLPEIAVMGAQMLMIAHQYETFVERGASPASALNLMSERPDTWQSGLVNAMRSLDTLNADTEVRTMRIEELRPRMVLNQDVRMSNGMLLAAKGNVLSDPVISRLINYSHSAELDGALSVRVPLSRPRIPEVATMASASRYSAQ